MKGSYFIKKGMTTVWKDGFALPVTVLQELKHTKVDDNILLWFGCNRLKIPQKKMLEQKSIDFEKQGFLKTMSYDELSTTYVDVTAVCKGKGFCGGMKRHNFRGLRASHGVSVSHRSIGGTGTGRQTNRTVLGTKMPGHLGNTRTTQLNLKVVEKRDDLLLLKGSVPGPKNCKVFVRRAIKKGSV